MGVAPSRAIYFCSYSNAKKFFNRRLKPDSPVVHMASAVCAGERRSDGGGGGCQRTCWEVWEWGGGVGGSRLRTGKGREGLLMCSSSQANESSWRGLFAEVLAAVFEIRLPISHLILLRVNIQYFRLGPLERPRLQAQSAVK